MNVYITFDNGSDKNQNYYAYHKELLWRND